MASRTSPGGGVASGKGAQEEDLYRRTDASRHTKRWYRSTDIYPLNQDQPIALIIKDVTIIRGTCDKGYPFLTSRNKFTMISMSAQKKPALIWTDGVASYEHIVEKFNMRQRIRVMLKAMKESGCDVVVVSAFGCGAFKHPPEEVALLFQDEIATAGLDLPFIVFAILDDHNTGLDHNPTGNLEVFARILKGKPTASSVSPQGDSEETGSPRVMLSPGLDEQEGMETDAAGGDDPFGSSSTAQPPTYQAGFESGTGLRPPYPSAETEGQGEASSTPSGSDAHMNLSRFAHSAAAPEVILTALLI